MGKISGNGGIITLFSGGKPPCFEARTFVKVSDMLTENRGSDVEAWEYFQE